MGVQRLLLKTDRHHASGFTWPGFTWATPYTFTPGTTIARVRLPFHVTPLLTSSGLGQPHPKM